MDDVEYIKRIDGYFPFGKARKWKPVVDEGIRLSDNAAYMALFAIVVARPRDLPRRESQRMVDYWSSKYDHPAKAIVLTAARAIIWNRPLSEEATLEYLDTIAPYRNLYSALGIVCAAVRSDDRIGEMPVSIERRHKEIVAEWSQGS
ncbi:MAG: hypothetical protein ACM3VT_14230 [Solirubrobacterales bacterium]